MKFSEKPDYKYLNECLQNAVKALDKHAKPSMYQKMINSFRQLSITQITNESLSVENNDLKEFRMLFDDEGFSTKSYSP